jgi:hypothetical protein
MKDDLFCRRGTFKVLASMALAMLILGCSSTKTVLVPVPPRIDLRGFDAIGMIDFAPESVDKLGHTATQQFMSAIHAEQPGVRFLELGSLERLLGQARRERIDPETVRLFGMQHKVDSVFTGTYEVSESLPQVSVDKDLPSMRASAKVKMSLTVRQWDTKTGATIWTKTRQGEWPVAKMKVETGRSVGVKMSDSRERYDEFMQQLVRAVTSDFAVQYERRPIATAQH